MKRRHAISIALGALGVTLALGAMTSRAAIEDDVFTSDKWRVHVELPTNWQATDQTAYPNILLWLERRNPRGVILFAAERVTPTLTAAEYAKKTTELLRKMGFETRAPQLHTTTGAYLVDFENDAAFLRQAFLIKQGIGYTLTLSASSSRLRGLHLRAFDTMLRRIKPLRETTSGGDGGERDEAGESDGASESDAPDDNGEDPDA